MSKDLDHVVKEMLQARRGKWAKIAKAAGVSETWVSQFMRGVIPNPGIETLRKIHSTIKKGEKAWQQPSDSKKDSEPPVAD